MEENRPGYYAVIPADVRYDDRIPANAKLLYGEISALIGADGFCYASNAYFCKIYGFSDSTITRLIGELVKYGYLIRECVRDNSGQIAQRKLWLKTSVPEIHPPLIFEGTPHQNKGEGTPKNEGETNPSITDIEKENKKEKSKPLTDEQLHALFVPWISGIAGDDWGRDEKNQLYFALVGFYEPRGEKKKEPARTKAAFTALGNRLVRYAGGSSANMIDMLERATTSKWKSVFPLPGTNMQPMKQSGGEEEIWLN